MNQIADTTCFGVRNIPAVLFTRSTHTLLFGQETPEVWILADQFAACFDQPAHLLITRVLLYLLVVLMFQILK